MWFGKNLQNVEPFEEANSVLEQLASPLSWETSNT